MENLGIITFKSKDVTFKFICFILQETSNREASKGRNKSVITIATTTAAAISGMLLFCIYAIYRVRRRIAGKLTFSFLLTNSQETLFGSNNRLSLNLRPSGL